MEFHLSLILWDRAGEYMDPMSVDGSIPMMHRLDFVKKYKAGLRFVMIKASDSRDEADALALKYVIMDRSAAQAAGIYTGFYHYASAARFKRFCSDSTRCHRSGAESIVAISSPRWI